MDSILSAFNTPVPMKVFHWDGDIDTVLSPMDSLRYYKFYLRGSLMAMEPSTGHVKAYVGGPNFKYFKYDQVTIGKRQVVSTFKPFLYTLAMQEGYSPCYEIPNVPQSFKDQDTIWTPRSAGREYLGKYVTLKWGLAHSINNVSAWLIKQFPPQTIIDDVARKVGIKSDLLAVPSIIYGTSDVSLYEMTGGFNTFVNKGVYIEPIFITTTSTITVCHKIFFYDKLSIYVKNFIEIFCVEFVTNSFHTEDINIPYYLYFPLYDI